MQKELRTLFVTIFLFTCSMTFAGNNFELFVAPDGQNNNKGTIESPLSLTGAIFKANKTLSESGLPEGGITIYLLGGEYDVTKDITLSDNFKGTKESPIVITNYDEAVSFDGSKRIGTNGFTKVTDSKEIAKLAESAKDEIYVKTITDPILNNKLKSAVLLNLGIEDEIYLPSCYPNEGYATLKLEYAVAEVSPPAIPSVQPKGAASRAGQPPFQEPGKPNAWKGSITEPRGAQAGIGNRENEMAGTWQQWANEINANNTRNMLTGFISADWLLESQEIYAANAEAKTIHLSRALAYGWHGDKHRKKDFKVYGLLCEIDQPGEWHFDSLTNRFYIYSPRPIDKIKNMGFPYGKGFMTLNAIE